MFKGVRISNLSEEQIKNARQNLIADCNGIGWILDALNFAWSDFKAGKFSYDGATFVKEYQDDFWEVAAFIHDWLNSIGYVGKQPDLYFIKIMITLNYGERRIFERAKWMQWTFINKWWHIIRFNFVADGLPKYLK